LATTEGNLRRLEDVIRQVQTADHSPSDAGSEAPESLEELEQMHRNLEIYRDAVCTAACHQFEGDSGAANSDMQCRLKLARDRMRELHLIYGEDSDL